MKLIQVAEAAERLGVSRQTLENWGNNGTIRIRRMGQTGNAHWVDADTIDALADTMQDVAHAREMLEKERADIEAEYRNEHNTLLDIRRQMYLVNKFGTSAFVKEFFLGILVMLEKIGKLGERECAIMRDIISGNDIKWIAEEYGLTRTRIAQIFYNGCRKAKSLENIREQLDELERLRQENTEMQNMMKVMGSDLKVQQMAEQKVREMEEAERIKYIRETDELLKLYSTRLVDCDLSVRALNCLRAYNFETVGDLAKCNKIDLLKFRNFGKKSLVELEDFLESLNLSFGTDVDEVYRDRTAQRLQEMG